MKRLVILFLTLSLLLYAVPAPAEQDAADAYTRGIEAYRNEDYAAALEAFTACVELDLTEGYHALAVLYLYGLGVEKSYARAAEYLQVPADRGHTDSQYLLGVLYMNGLGVPKSQETGAEYLRKAAEQGSEDAQKLLDSIPEEGSEAFLEQLREDAARADLELPEPGEGERVYLGKGRVPETQLTEIFVVLVAAPNLMKIRSITIYGYGLEVPREGMDPWLINSRVFSSAEDWMFLDAKSKSLTFSFSDRTGTGLESLVLDGTGGSCIASICDTYVNEAEHIDSSYSASAGVTLYCVAGDAAMPPADPPTLRQLREVNMTIPEAAEGETLFIGRANVSQAGAAYVAFVLTADGKEIRGLTCLMKDLEVEYMLGNTRVRHTSSDYSTSVSGTLEIAEEIAAGSARLEQFALDGDTASCIFSFTYSDEKNSVDYPLGSSRVTFVKAE